MAPYEDAPAVLRQLLTLLRPHTGHRFIALFYRECCCGQQSSEGLHIEHSLDDCCSERLLASGYVSIYFSHHFYRCCTCHAHNHRHNFFHISALRNIANCVFDYCVAGRANRASKPVTFSSDKPQVKNAPGHSASCNTLRQLLPQPPPLAAGVTSLLFILLRCSSVELFRPHASLPPAPGTANERG